jgi:hypothetical protein
VSRDIPRDAQMLTISQPAAMDCTRPKQPVTRVLLGSRAALGSTRVPARVATF